jgi:hypothetical protein
VVHDAFGGPKVGAHRHNIIVCIAAF